MTELTKKQEDFLREYVFFDGWNDPSKLNYLPKDKIESYEKVHSMDYFEYFKQMFVHLEEFKVPASDWFRELLFPVLPTTDKEIEYFINNNYTYEFLRHISHTAVKGAIRDKIKEAEAKIERVKQLAFEQTQKDFEKYKEGLVWLKEQGYNPANDFAKIGMKELGDIIVRDKRRPKGSSNETIKRDDDIRAKYVEMESKGLTHKHIQKTLGEEYGKKPSTIKKIYYKYDYTQKEQGD